MYMYTFFFATSQYVLLLNGRHLMLWRIWYNIATTVTVLNAHVLDDPGYLVGVAIGDVDAVDAHDPVAAAQPDALGVRAALNSPHRHRRRAADREAVALGAALDHQLKRVRHCTI